MAIGMLLIRADVGGGVGAGHLMRCLALAEAWIARGGGAVFAVPPGLPDGLAARITGIGAEIAWLPPDSEPTGWLADLAGARGAAWVVIDGYGFGADYLAAIERRGHHLLVLDDDARRDAYPGDLILNQNLHARPEDYHAKTEARLLLGPSHALIRSEFRVAGGWKRAIPTVAEKVLVTLGGADPGGHTERLVGAFHLLAQQANGPAPSVRIVVGAANPRLVSLREIVEGHPNLELLSDVQDMGEQMRWCDSAVSASGSTVWELALFAVPMLLATASEVEEPVADSLQAIGAARHLGRLSELDVATLVTALREVLSDDGSRARLSAAAAGLVDGKGADRVIDQMLAISTQSA